MFLALGAQDLHLTLTGKIDFRIQCMLAAWKRKDPPVSCVKPIPIQILKRIAFVATKLPPTSNLLQATANMITTAFFFLLCSGEYTDLSSTDATPITLQMSNILHHQLDLSAASDAELLEGHSALLTFTHQKNGVENEVLCLGRSGDPFLCPVLALACHTIMHHQPHTFLCLYILWTPGCHFFLHHFSAPSGCYLPWYGFRVSSF